jgi:uncharacterized protein YpmS
MFVNFAVSCMCVCLLALSFVVVVFVVVVKEQIDEHTRKKQQQN